MLYNGLRLAGRYVGFPDLESYPSKVAVSPVFSHRSLSFPFVQPQMKVNVDGGA
jgi:hypothetical protein